MAYAPLSTYNSAGGDGSILGQFVEKDHGRTFEFSTADSTPFEGFGELVWIRDEQSRYARILKTVAYVVVDEDENGDPVVEKWNIKRHTLYA